MVVTWAEEHDELLRRLKTPGGFAEEEARILRQHDKALDDYLPPGVEQMVEEDGELIPISLSARPWHQVDVKLKELEASRQLGQAPVYLVNQLSARILKARESNEDQGVLRLPPYPELLSMAGEMPPDSNLLEVRFDKELPPPMSDERYRDELMRLNQDFFGDGCHEPDDLDERDEYQFAKRKLERRIASVSPDPNTLFAVLETYCDFNSIRAGTRAKYRREVGRLVAISGDVPVNHVTTDDLRQLRDSLIGDVQPASIQAVFTPIKSLLAFAFDEDMIDSNPMMGVKLPRDKRPIEERKWKAFEPREVERLLRSASDHWTEDSRGLSPERREAILMVVRVLAFSGMRPIEVIRLQPSDVNDRLIRVTGSKTESSTRVVPLHPEISDFPSFVADGGLETFQSIKTDRVNSVRHNFGRLLREKMDPPISDPKKALYSLRSTFVNAMRRAGADIQVQRAILGHKEAGAIRHYDDGPEFEVKKKWVEATDPRK